jgi:hypothetical protein
MNTCTLTQLGAFFPGGRAKCNVMNAFQAELNPALERLTQFYH